MAKLLKTPYTADVGDAPVVGGRRASGEDFGGGVGAALQSIGGTAQKIAAQQLADIEQREERQVLVAQAKIRQNYAKQLEDAELSGADVDQIRQKLEDEVSKVGENMATRRGLEASEMHGANTLNIYDSAVSQIKVRRASLEAKTAARDFISANSALLTTNPSYLPLAEGEIDAFLETYKGRLPPEQLAEMGRGLRQQMNVAAVSALIRLAPEDAKTRLEKGQFDLSPEQRVQEIGRADLQIRAIRAERAAERAEAESEIRKTSDSARDEWFREIMNNTPGTLRQIIGDLRLTPEHREHLVVLHENWLKSKFGADKQSNPNVVRNLLLDIHAPEGSKRKIYTDDKIYDALKDGDLSTSDFRMLKGEVANARDPNNSPVSRRFGEAMNQFSQAMNNDIQLRALEITQPGSIAAGVLAWAASARDKMDEYRRDNKNPTLLFDPRSKESLVTPEYFATFVSEARNNAKTQTNTQAKRKAVPGDIVDGWEFLGGDPANQKNWKKADIKPIRRPEGE